MDTIAEATCGHRRATRARWCEGERHKKEKEPKVNTGKSSQAKLTLGLDPQEHLEGVAADDIPRLSEATAGLEAGAGQELVNQFHANVVTPEC